MANKKAVIFPDPLVSDLRSLWCPKTFPVGSEVSKSESVPIFATHHHNEDSNDDRRYNDVRWRRDAVIFALSTSKHFDSNIPRLDIFGLRCRQILLFPLPPGASRMLRAGCPVATAIVRNIPMNAYIYYSIPMKARVSRTRHKKCVRRLGGGGGERARRVTVRLGCDAGHDKKLKLERQTLEYRARRGWIW
jgi:hypothetical protein